MRLIFALCFIFSVSPIFALDYYWVGGTGDWSDIAHWATSSGGNVNHVQVPTSNDNVIFDNNSFTGPNQIVTVNLQIIYSRDFDFSGVTNSPTISSDNKATLNINGSFRLATGMTWDFLGVVNFIASNSGHTIDMTNKSFHKSIYFNGLGGGWDVQSQIEVDSLIGIYNGSINFNGNSITSDYMEWKPFNSVSLNIQNSNILLKGKEIIMYTYDTTHVFEMVTDNLTLVATGSIIEFSSSTATLFSEGSSSKTFGDLLFSNGSGRGKIDNRGTNNIFANEVTFRGNGFLGGNNIMSHLIFSANHRYTFASGSTQRVINMTSIGSCQGFIFLQASSAGTAASLFASSGNNISLNYTAVRGINTSGGATFVINNGIDLGNNMGWTINEKSNETFYWVGGSGNWSNPNNWSSFSGGPGGSCVPSAVDDVIFDNNSFSAAAQRVNIDVLNADCKNMTWTGVSNNPEFYSVRKKDVRIFGSLILDPNMTTSISGDVYFVGKAKDQTILMNGNSFSQNVIFDNVNGGWIFSDKFEVEDSLIFKSGILNTNGSDVICFGFYSNFSSPRNLQLGNSEIGLRNKVNGNSIFMAIGVDNLIISPGTSHIIFGAQDNLTVWGYLQFYTNQYNTPKSINLYDITFNTNGSMYSHPIVDPTFHDVVFNRDGELYNSNSFNKLTFTSPNFYRLEVGQTQTANEIISNGTCDGYIYITSSSTPDSAIIKSFSGNLTLDNVMLRDIHAFTGDNYNANNSADGGNNLGWTIQDETPRNLYWVGDQGLWHDRNHWSLSSGGPGGECVPTLIDNVFIDEKSFTTTNTWIDFGASRSAVCHNMDWTEAPSGFNVSGGEISIYGSFIGERETMMYSWSTNFKSDISETIQSNGTIYGYTTLDGLGDWTLLDSFYAQGSIYHANGTFHTNDQSVNIFTYNSGHNPIFMHLGNSTMVLRESSNFAMYVRLGHLTILPGNSTVKFTGLNPTMNLRMDYNNPISSLRFHNVEFENPDGTLILENHGDGYINYNTLLFRGNGDMFGRHQSDTLLLTEGKSYRNNAGMVQRVMEHMQIRGNACTPIALSSTQVGSKATFYKPDGIVDGNYIEMRDQETLGSATFYAGANSTNINNSNTGWIFDHKDDYIETGFLGEDEVLCESSTVELSAYSSSEGEQYLWHDNSTDSIFQVDQSGQYYVKITFRDNCVISDTINVFTPEDFTPNLGQDTSICEGEVLELDADLGSPYLTYKWQDGSTDSKFLVDQPGGTYSVELTLGECITNDTITIDYLPKPKFNIKQDQGVCSGDTYTIIAPSIPNASFLWPDNSSDTSLLVTTPGIYWLESTRDGCTFRDSLDIVFQDPPPLELGPDLSPCEGTNLSLDAFINNSTYLWSDNSTSSSFPVNQSGNYWVEVTNGACIVSDTVSVVYKPEPQFSLNSDTTTCDGSVLDLILNVPNASFLWSDNTSLSAISVSQSSDIWVVVDLNGCIKRDSISVNFAPVPMVNFGSDTTLCEGEILNLDASNSGASYSWQDGTSLPGFQVSNAGIYSVAAQLGACTGGDTIEVAYNPLPIFTLGEDTSLCDGQVYEINGTADAGSIYSWQDGSDLPMLQVNTSDVFWIDVDLNGCIKRDSVLVNFAPVPMVNFGSDTTLCEGETLSLDATNSGASYSWQDGSSLPGFQVSNAGIYSVAAQLGTCAGGDTIEVAYNPLPNFTLGEDTSLCDGQIYEINGTADAGSIYSWQDGSNLPMLQVNTSDVFWIDVDLNGCIKRDSVLVNFAPVPMVNFGSDTTLCEGETLSLDATNSGASYSWQDGSSLPGFQVSNAGIYSVAAQLGTCAGGDTIEVAYNPLPNFTLGEDTSLCDGQVYEINGTADAGSTYSWKDGSNLPMLQVNTSDVFWIDVDLNGCIKRDSVLVNFAPVPMVNFGSDTTLCEGETLSLDATNSGASYSWQDGSSLPGFQVSNAGIYSVAAQLGTCAGGDTIEVAYNPLPTFTLGEDTSLCDGQVYEINGIADAGSTYSWKDGSTLPMMQVNTSGVFWIDVDLNGCVKRDSVDVDFAAAPIVNFGPDTTLCEGEILQLSAVNPGAVYEWNDGTLDPELYVSGPGSFFAIASIGSCTDSDTIQILYNPLPNFDLGRDTALCEGETFALDASAETGSTYSWNTNSNLAEIETSTSDIYWVDVNLNGCIKRDSVEIIYNQVPIVEFGPDRVICDGDKFTLFTSDVPGSTFTWQDGSTDSVFLVDTGGVFYVHSQAANCSDTDTIVFEFRPSPFFSLRKDTVLCPADVLILDASYPGVTYTWQDGSTLPQYQVVRRGDYFVELDLNGCIQRDQVFIDYHQTDFRALGQDTTICNIYDVVLDVGIDDGTYIWSTGETTPKIVAATDGIYSVDVFDGFCSFNDQIEIVTRECHFFNLYIPNAFSPNYDGANDEFRPHINPNITSVSNYRFQIFNRWGHQIFETTDMNKGWEGELNSELLPSGVYVYYVQFDFVDDDGPGKMKRTGDITLIR